MIHVINFHASENRRRFASLEVLRLNSPIDPAKYYFCMQYIT